MVELLTLRVKCSCLGAKTGHISGHLPVVPEKDNQARVQFTIRKANSFVTRYYGKAAFQEGQLYLDVMSI
jgi:hypothetical protein